MPSNPQQIIFFKKNFIDLDNDEVTITSSDTVTANDGNALTYLLQNRNNFARWGTTGADDTSVTTIDIDLIDQRPVTDIIIVDHNLKEFTFQYWNGSAYVDFSTAINETTNTKETNHYSFNSVTANKFRMTASKTITANEDKLISQIIITEKIGQLNGWPVIKKPIIGTNKRKIKMLSGKKHIVENVGAYSASLQVKVMKDSADYVVYRTLYTDPEGLLIWPCGGSEDQFWTSIDGYRLEDIFLVKPEDEFNTELYKGMYGNGVKLSINITEIV